MLTEKYKHIEGKRISYDSSTLCYCSKISSIDKYCTVEIHKETTCAINTKNLRIRYIYVRISCLIGNWNLHLQL
jgi:hypothetical protein